MPSIPLKLYNVCWQSSYKLNLNSCHLFHKKEQKLYYTTYQIARIKSVHFRGSSRVCLHLLAPYVQLLTLISSIITLLGKRSQLPLLLKSLYFVNWWIIPFPNKKQLQKTSLYIIKSLFFFYTFKHLLNTPLRVNCILRWNQFHKTTPLKLKLQLIRHI